MQRPEIILNSFVIWFWCYGQELEEREKLVRQMWDVYTQSKTARLPSFWLEAFEAAYEELTSDVPGVRNAAVSEIARMSLRSISFEPLTVLSTVSPIKNSSALHLLFISIALFINTWALHLILGVFLSAKICPFFTTCEFSRV